MYIDNVRNYLKKMNEPLINDLSLIMYSKIKSKYTFSMKPSEIIKSIDRFKYGGEMSLKYFEILLESLDVLYDKGVENILFAKNSSLNPTWRDMLYVSLDKKRVSDDLKTMFEDEKIREEAVDIFVKLMKYLINTEPSTTALL